MIQDSLFSQKAPAVSSSEVERLVVALKGCGWVTARDLVNGAKWAGWTLDDRTVRALASASEGRIISGQRGYCRIEEATVEEANHAASWLEHQAKAMAQRASEIRRAMHKRHAA